MSQSLQQNDKNFKDLRAGCNDPKNGDINVVPYRISLFPGRTKVKMREHSEVPGLSRSSLVSALVSFGTRFELLLLFAAAVLLQS